MPLEILSYSLRVLIKAESAAGCCRPARVVKEKPWERLAPILDDVGREHHQVMAGQRLQQKAPTAITSITE